jgi:hypothetical protein
VPEIVKQVAKIENRQSATLIGTIRMKTFGYGINFMVFEKPLMVNGRKLFL